MKVTLTEAQTIKARDFEAGAEVIVAKEVGERMIEEGLANRVIEEPENRMTPIRFSGHKKIFQGSDGKNYHAKGDSYVEVKE